MTLRLVLSAFLLTSAVLARAAETTSTPPLRVLTFNIHHGEGLDRRIDLERIAAVIRNCGADIVALQEVDRGIERTQKRDLPRELSGLTRMAVYFERNIVHQGGDYGNAVLTRFPVVRSRNTHFRMPQPGEQRGVLQVVLNVHGRDVLFMSTHIDFQKDDSNRLSNAEEMRAMVSAAGTMPVFICGDFNATPDSRTYERMTSFLTDAWAGVGKGPGFTIPAAKPAKRIDYIFVSANVEPLRMDVIRSDASDHLPVFGEFRLR